MELLDNISSIIKSVNSSTDLNKENVLELLKNGLRDISKESYEEWEQSSFDVNHNFIRLQNNSQPLDGEENEGSSEEVEERGVLNDKDDNRPFDRMTAASDNVVSTAAKLECANVLRALLDSGAKADTPNTKKSTPLLLAAEIGHEETVKILLSFNADVNKRNIFQRTPLSVAVVNNNLSVCELLIENGADVNCKGFENETVLYQAAKRGNLEMVKYLVDRQADVKAITIHGKDPLLKAIVNGYLEITKFFIKETNVDVSRKTIKTGSTSLHLASFNGHLGIVQYLVDETKLDIVSAVNYLGYTAVHSAAVGGHLNVLRYLVDTLQMDYRSNHFRHIDALRMAILFGHLDIVKYFVEEKKIDLRQYYRNPLYFACGSRCKRDMVEYIIDQGINVNAGANKNRTPLMLSSKYGKLEIVKFLVEEKGADVNLQDVYGHPALHFAMQFCQVDVAMFLIGKGAHTQIMSKDHGTLLHYAVYTRNLKFVKYILEEHEGWLYMNSKIAVTHLTPLHVAVRQGNLDIAEYLIDNGAKLHYSDLRGGWPLQVAAENGDIALARLLIDKGSRLNAKNKQGLTPLHIALEANNYDMEELLIQRGANTAIWDNRGKTAKDLKVKRNIEQYSKVIDQKASGRAMTSRPDTDVFLSAFARPIHKT